MSVRSKVQAVIGMVAVIASIPASALAIDYAKLYADVSPAVVTVNTRTIKVSESGIGMVPGIGTGFMIEANLVMTAAHVVTDVDLVRVRFNDETYIGADVVAIAKDSDVALLRLEKPRVDAVLAKLGDSDAIAIGSPVFVVGAPYGIEQTLSVGYLSGRMTRGKTASGSPIEFLQTDTAINPGNSGGPMFNDQGEVIGVVSFILSKSGGFDGIGFAGSVNSAHNVLINSTEYVAGFYGLKLTEKQSRALSIPAEGVLIQRVIEGSVADDLGLKAGTISARIATQELLLGGDVILSVTCRECTDDKPKLDVNYFAEKLSRNQALEIRIFRDGEVINLSKNTDRDSNKPENFTPIADITGLSMLSPN